MAVVCLAGSKNIKNKYIKVYLKPGLSIHFKPQKCFISICIIAGNYWQSCVCAMNIHSLCRDLGSGRTDT